MNLILLEPDDLHDPQSAVLTDARAVHIRTVLRAQAGQRIRVGLLNGPFGTAVVRRIDDNGVALACDFEPTPPPRPQIDLLLALPRPKVLRRLWAQLAALGVGRIVLTNAERVERNYFDTTVLSPEVYRPLLIEGLQQARDTWLPTIDVRRQLKVFVEDELDEWSGDGVRLVADPSAPTVDDALRASPPRSGDRVLVAVGPEGGWTSFELGLLAKHGFHGIGIGARTLRVDTACIALLAVVGDACRRMAVVATGRDA